FIGLLVVVTIIALSAAILLPVDAGIPPAIHKAYPPTDEVFPNPERGFYRAVNLERERDLKRIREGGSTLVYSNIRLDAARDGPISEALLQSVEDGLQAARSAG